MTLVFVSKSLSVDNPVGYVNVHPLPTGLPTGLVRAHLMRTAKEMLALNLLDGSLTGLEWSVGTGGSLSDITVADTYVHSGHGRAGWEDPEYEVSYAVGYTWLTVGNFDNTLNSYQAGTMNSASDVGEEFSFRQDAIQFLASRAPQEEGPQFTRASITLDPVPSGLMAGFAILDRVGGNVGVYVPHTNTIDMRAEKPDTTPPSSKPGLYLGRGSDNWGTTNTEANTKIAFFAAWSRPLSQAEMFTAYSKLKPWLLARGVEIA